METDDHPDLFDAEADVLHVRCGHRHDSYHDNLLINEISRQLIISSKGCQSSLWKVIQLIRISALFYFCGSFVVFQNMAFER